MVFITYGPALHLLLWSLQLLTQFAPLGDGIVDESQMLSLLTIDNDFDESWGSKNVTENVEVRLLGLSLTDN